MRSPFPGIDPDTVKVWLQSNGELLRTISNFSAVVRAIANSGSGNG
ncbi:MAG: hypothetical protein VKL59_23480 [Nostocaceae cyanobacterium]|nr:hypothetical protein [Nostocaceae cyanobacterium]